MKYVNLAAATLGLIACGDDDPSRQPTMSECTGARVNSSGADEDWTYEYADPRLQTVDLTTSDSTGGALTAQWRFTWSGDLLSRVELDLSNLPASGEPNYFEFSRDGQRLTTMGYFRPVEYPLDDRPWTRLALTYSGETLASVEAQRPIEYPLGGGEETWNCPPCDDTIVDETFPWPAPLCPLPTLIAERP